MYKYNFSNSLGYCIEMLQKKNIIAYPTESMFGLGCDPSSKEAVLKLLNLKKRDIKKGLILVASHFNQIKKYINENLLSIKQKKELSLHWPGHITYLLPANINTPYWLTGQFKTIAVRISDHIGIIQLCNAFKGAIISTSANISSMIPCTTFEEVLQCFGNNFPILHGEIGDKKKPSKIINITDGKLIRYA